MLLMAYFLLPIWLMPYCTMWCIISGVYLFLALLHTKSVVVVNYLVVGVVHPWVDGSRSAISEARVRSGFRLSMMTRDQIWDCNFGGETRGSMHSRFLKCTCQKMIGHWPSSTGVHDQLSIAFIPVCSCELQVHPAHCACSSWNLFVT